MGCQRSSYLIENSNQFKVNYLPDGSMQVMLNNVYILSKNSIYYKQMSHLITNINAKNKRTVFDDSLKINYFSSLEFILGNHQMDSQVCAICMENFEIKDIEKQLQTDSEKDIYQLKCNHRFHRQCLQSYIKEKTWIKCPIDNSIFGKMIGDMPEGKMNVEYNGNIHIKCNGFIVGTHVINYKMFSGIRDGKQYPGTTRIAYIPDTKQGREVLTLLTQAFKRKLTFTVGRSVTTGKDNRITWNGIHHKTKTNGGSTNFGYPDETYFKRVKEELALKGVIYQ